MKKIKNMFGEAKRWQRGGANDATRTDSTRLDEDAVKKERGSEIAFGGRLGDFVSPTGMMPLKKKTL